MARGRSGGKGNYARERFTHPDARGIFGRVNPKSGPLVLASGKSITLLTPRLIKPPAYSDFPRFYKRVVSPQRRHSRSNGSSDWS